ncbi:putative transcriptional regulator [Sphingobacterium sp. PM2-P1-29]|nr:putative transcriptional regulator [Sphingobacterium sp. PM2-P1-29]
MKSEKRKPLIIGEPESDQLEYKAVLPPARSLAQMIAAFANSAGGFIVLGVHQANGEITIAGLSEDFHANSVTHKAIDLLLPKPIVKYEYITHKSKRLYVIDVSPSTETISIENKIYFRNGAQNVLRNPEVKESNTNRLPLIQELTDQLTSFRLSGTGSKSKFIDHYSSVLNIIEDLGNLLYPISISVPTTNQEGKILIRILLSSCADNFEIYLSDLLYEIFLANPSSLKSSQQVTVKEVLDCADMQEFVLYCAKKKLSKLQRGSVRGFIADNEQIRNLNIINLAEQDSIEKILQIRHLYAHRNGIVDEKFLQFYPGQFTLNEEHQLSIKDMLDHFLYLSDVVDKIDKAAIKKYQLATL